MWADSELFYDVKYPNEGSFHFYPDVFICECYCFRGDMQFYSQWFELYGPEIYCLDGDESVFGGCVCVSAEHECFFQFVKSNTVRIWPVAFLPINIFQFCSNLIGPFLWPLVWRGDYFSWEIGTKPVGNIPIVPIPLAVESLSIWVCNIKGDAVIDVDETPGWTINGECLLRGDNSEITITIISNYSVNAGDFYFVVCIRDDGWWDYPWDATVVWCIGFYGVNRGSVFV